MMCSWWEFSLALYLVVFMVAGVNNSSGELPQPENLTVSWSPDHLKLTAQWSRPTRLEEHCKVNYTIDLCSEKCPPRGTELKTCEKRRTENLMYTWDKSNEKDLCVVIRTNPNECGKMKASKAVYKYIPSPLALVKNFTCVYYSNMKMNCTWRSVRDASDLQLSYRQNSDHLKPCASYLTDGNIRTGCHLDDIYLSDDTGIFINRTVEGSEIPNTFIVEPKNSVKIEAPKLHITKKDKYIVLHSSIPNFSPSCWKYKFIYSKCNEERHPEAQKFPEYCLEYDDVCEYRVQSRTIFTTDCGAEMGSELSEPVYFGKNTDLNEPFVVAMIVIPLIVSCCLIVALVLFRRYKDIILPKIPEPSLLFKDILNTNNDGKYLKSLYEPITEVVEGGVKLEPSSTPKHPNHDTCS